MQHMQTKTNNNNKRVTLSKFTKKILLSSENEYTFNVKINRYESWGMQHNGTKKHFDSPISIKTLALLR